MSARRFRRHETAPLHDERSLNAVPLPSYLACLI